MKVKATVGYEWKDGLKGYSNHTASVMLELVPDDAAEAAKLKEQIVGIRHLCQREVYDAIMDGRAEVAARTALPEPEPEQPDLRPGDRGYQEPHPAVERARQPAPEPARRPYSQDEYDRDRQYEEPRQQDRRQERPQQRNGNGSGGYNGGGRQGGGGRQPDRSRRPRRQFLGLARKAARRGRGTG